MAQILDNPLGRRMIRLSTDDVISIVSSFQQKCNCKNYSYDEVRNVLDASMFYLPEECT